MLSAWICIRDMEIAGFAQPYRPEKCEVHEGVIPLLEATLLIKSHVFHVSRWLIFEDLAIKDAICHLTSKPCILRTYMENIYVILLVNSIYSTQVFVLMKLKCGIYWKSNYHYYNCTAMKYQSNSHHNITPRIFLEWQMGPDFIKWTR